MSGLLVSGLINALTTRLSAVRAAYLDYINDLNTRLTATRAGYLDNLTRLDANVSTVGGLKCRFFTSSTTWTSPTSSVSAMVLAIGGGGGGAYSTSGGSAGGTTSFGALVSAAGGSGGVASGSPGTTGYAMGAKSDQAQGDVWTALINANGGAGFLGIGHGGAAMPTTSGAGFGGNSGAVATYFGTIAAETSITVTIGAGGAGGGDSSGGRQGSAGAILLFYW